MKVAYLTMCYMPLLWPRRIFTVLWQQWPHEEKVHILLHQKSNNSGKFPPVLKHDMPFQIIEKHVDGTWPALWMFKMKAGVEAAKEAGAEYCVILDEDDEFPPTYTDRNVYQIIGDKADGVWNYRNIDVKRGLCFGYDKAQEYNSAIGTLVMRTDKLHEAITNLAYHYPHGRRKPDKGGALDARFKKVLADGYRIVESNAEGDDIRGYFRTRFTNTTRRPYNEDIDFDFSYQKAMREERPVKKDPKWLKEVHAKRNRK